LIEDGAHGVNLKKMLYIYKYIYKKCPQSQWIRKKYEEYRRTPSETKIKKHPYEQVKKKHFPITLL